jgi:hypothetical protein
LSHRYKERKEYLEARETGTEVRLNDIEGEIAALSKPLPKPELPLAPSDEDERRYTVALKDWRMDHAEREFNLACARERLRAVAWRAEREFPQRWGVKGNAINVQVNALTLDQALADELGQLVASAHAVAPQEGAAASHSPVIDAIPVSEDR